MAAHESPRTTKLYDRTKERLTQDEVERIRRFGAKPDKKIVDRSSGERAMTALLVLRNKAIKPLLAAAQPLHPARAAHNPKPIDAHYKAIRVAMNGVFHELGLSPVGSGSYRRE